MSCFFIKYFKTAIAITFCVSVTLGSQSNSVNPQQSDWEFNYRDLGQWTKHYKVCGGTHQSPIDLTTGPDGDVQKISYFPPLELKGYHQRPDGMNLTNNGHTVVVTVTQGMTTTGGCLSDKSFHFTQLHFHWGSNDSVGSEHQKNGHKYPIEFHFVHYNEKYASLNDALDHPDGILVLAVWGELTEDTDNPALAPITHALTLIQNDHAVTKVIGEPIHPLRELLPDEADTYFHYQGSLTTPDCHESVTWIVFNKTVPISESQLNEFRNLHQGGELKLPLVDNFRPLQAVNGRIVEIVIASNGNLTKFTWLIFVFSLLFHKFRLIR